MGASSSTDANDGKGTNLSASEKSKVNAIFADVCRKSNSKDKFQLAGLQAYISDYVSEMFVGRLYHAMKIQCKHQGKADFVDEAAFTIFLTWLINGTNDDILELLICFILSGKDVIVLDDIQQILKELGSKYFALRGKETWVSTAKDGNIRKYTEKVLRDLCFPRVQLKKLGTLDPAKNEYSSSEVESWVMKSPEVSVMFKRVLSQIFEFKDMAQVEDNDDGLVLPELILPKGNLKYCLLDIPSILTINGRLANDLKKEWTLLFSSEKHGQSFSTLVQHIKNEGQTMVVVRDKGGNVFGGVTSHSWELNPDFTGNDTCFLFHLHPHLAIYETTGYNNHFMYLNMNQETLPNGLGMGGQLDYFGFWIDSNYGQGKCSKGCTTYDSPMLGSSEQFELDVLEVWRVGPKPKLDEDEEESRISVLDKDPEAKAMLMMIDKGVHSEGLREADPQADSPDEKEMPLV